MATKANSTKPTKAKATKAKATPEEDVAVTDPAPVLAPVSPDFSTDDLTGVDPDTFPALRDFRRILPAQRLTEQAKLGKLMETIPEQFRDAANGQDVDLSKVTGDDLDALAATFTAIQDIILGAAEDREAMTEWLIDQEDSLQAVLYGFTQYQGSLGN